LSGSGSIKEFGAFCPLERNSHDNGMFSATVEQEQIKLADGGSGGKLLAADAKI
jgi:hypothetical protein